MPHAGSAYVSFDIPFDLPNIQRNSDFVGREYFLEQLKQAIEEGVATKDIIHVVLYGMGGIGKTQLVLEYVYRHCEDYSSVFWINAATEATLKIGFTYIVERLIEHYAKYFDELDYTQVGRMLGMAGELDPAGLFTLLAMAGHEHEVVNAVKEWFAAEGNANWLLVFENVNDFESFDMNDYIPSTPHGTVIITSRRRESILGRRALESLAMATSTNVGYIEHDREKEAAAAIVQKLGYLPLAIAQAGAYIRNSQCLFSHYLREYQENAIHLLSTRWSVGKRDDRSVFAAWDLSFDAIQLQNPGAAEILLLCGILDHNDICEELLRHGMKSLIDDACLQRAIQTLFMHSMVKRRDRDDSFCIHPLVHTWVQWKLKAEPERHTIKAIEALLMVASAILNTLCRVCMKYGYYKKTEEMGMAVLAGSVKLQGEEHLDTIARVNSMAKVFHRRGQYDKALEWFQQALPSQERALGVDHPETLTTVKNLAMVFHDQGQYTKALDLLERPLTGQEKALGTDHPETLTTVKNLATVFHDQGQYTKALNLLERALAGQEKALGTDHPETLTTVKNLAMVLHDQGQYTKALQLLERALVGQEKALGIEHPSTLTTVHNIAMVVYDQGQYTKALPLLERALAGQEKPLGAYHQIPLPPSDTWPSYSKQLGSRTRR
ncbi:P-loop containing nucleoside triphosphate hydrolase protein [Kalaharituber pfeilii]|nr:P-loop containing nucleoside triphosphate hydrolase protein [Kalaharituber pfeilii]